MRFTLAFLAAAAVLALAACTPARAVDSRTALAQSNYTPSARAAIDGSPGLPGPQELLALYVPAGPFAVKGAVVWDGTTFAVPTPIGPQAAPYASSDACGWAPAASASGPDPASDPANWVYVGPK